MELRLALGEIDYQRAIRALIDLKKTGTIDFNRAGQLSSALGVVRKVDVLQVWQGWLVA